MLSFSDATGIRTRVAAVRGRSLNRLTIEPGYEKRASLEALLKIGDSIENRTRVTAVKGRCLNRLTMEPRKLHERCSFLLNWRCPTFPGRFQPSILSAKELNFCVRDGNRCDLFAIITRSSCAYAHAPLNIYRYLVSGLYPEN